MCNTKICFRCKNDLPLEDYKYRTDKPHLKMSYCIKCYNSKRYERRKKNDPELKAKDKGRDLKRRYNLSLEEYYRMYIDQNHRCAICGKKSENKKLAVDHNHSTGAIRALLCSNCNTMIGLAKEDPYILQSAMNYLFIHNN